MDYLIVRSLPPLNPPVNVTRMCPGRCDFFFFFKDSCLSPCFLSPHSLPPKYLHTRAPAPYSMVPAIFLLLLFPPRLHTQIFSRTSACPPLPPLLLSQPLPSLAYPTPLTLWLQHGFSLSFILGHRVCGCSGPSLIMQQLFCSSSVRHILNAG